MYILLSKKPKCRNKFNYKSTCRSHRIRKWPTEETIVFLTVELGIGQFSKIKEVEAKRHYQSGVQVVDIQIECSRKLQLWRKWAQAKGNRE